MIQERVAQPEVKLTGPIDAVKRAKKFLDWVHEETGVNPKVRTRRPEVSRVRRVSVTVMRQWGLSWGSIAIIMGRDHATAYQVMRKYGTPEDLVDANALMQRFTAWYDSENSRRSEAV